MDTAGTERGGMPRVLSRALFVLGGAVVATATAWLISSASASADILPAPPDGSTISDTSISSISDITSGALASVGVHPGALSSMPVVSSRAALPLAGDPGQVAARVRGVLGSAVHQLGVHVPVARNLIVRALAGLPVSTAPAMPTPAARADRTAEHGAVRTSTRHTATPNTRTPNTSKSDTFAPATTAPAASGSVVARRSGPLARLATGGRPGPTAPASPTSSTPVTAPAAPGGSGGAGVSGAGGFGGLVDQLGTFPVPGLDLVHVVPVTAALGSVTAGRQPGITPD